MYLSAATLRLLLHRGDTLQIRNAARCEFRCHTGRMWITEEGNRKDVWLTPREGFVSVCRGLTLLSAEQESELEVRRPAAAASRAFVFNPRDARSHVL